VLKPNGSMIFQDHIDGAHAVWFNCPCGNHSNCIAFEPVVGTEPTSAHGLSMNGGRWRRTGDTLDTLTLSPSIAVKSAGGAKECWHGFIRDGAII